MTFPKGQWTTEYGIKQTSPRGQVHVYAHNTAEVAQQMLEFLRQSGVVRSELEVVTRQAFYGEWQPLPERTNT